MTDDVTFDAPEEVITIPGVSEPVLIVRKDGDGGGLFGHVQFEVWLEPHARAHELGLCIGTGKTRALALADAHRELQRLATEALLALHQP